MVNITFHTVNGTSMAPNFDDGEIHTVYRLEFLSSEPQRGDVVSAHLDPENQEATYLKRVIGVEGDKIRFTIDGLLLSINDEWVEYGDVSSATTYIHQYSDSQLAPTLDTAAFSKVINESHSGISYDIMFLHSPPSAMGTYSYLERKRTSGYYDTFTYNEDGIAEIVVPKEHYFLLSDNRPSGFDSRVTGFLHKSKIYHVVEYYD